MLEMNEFQVSLMKQRYALPKEESWSDVASRVSEHLAKAENNGDMPIWERRFRDIMSNGYFFPGGRVLYGSGRRIGGLLNCFCLDIDDNRHSIAKNLHDMYIITSSGGGIGISYSKIRPKGDPIQGVQGVAPGAVSEIKKIDAVGSEIKSGGGRRCALLATLSIDHPDVLEFLAVKTNKQALNNHNISISYTKKFFDAVKQDKDWTFSFRGQEYKVYRLNVINNGEHVSKVDIPATSQENAIITAENFYKKHYQDQFEFSDVIQIKAKDLFKKIVNHSVETGEPGFLFVDNILKNFAPSYFEEFCNPNPCVEALLPADGNCCLGSINLSAMYDEETKDVNWKLLGRVIRTAVRALDNVLTMNVYPTPETKVRAELSRRIGLGVMGLHHLLIKLDLRYGSEKSIEFIERLFATIRNEAFDASIDLAQEKGPFTAYDYDKYTQNAYIQKLPTRLLNKMKKHGIRNAVLLSCAPTGTISAVAGTSSGIEPIFAPIYKRRYYQKSVLAEEIIVDPIFKNAILSGSSFEEVAVGAYDVTPAEHVAVQAAVQDNIDQAISKTINLPADYNYEDMIDVILDYSDRLKGLTFYKAGSRGEEPLSVIAVTAESISQYIYKGTATVEEQSCNTGACEI
jgi:ribonucleoside-diphosphate reductase alpha chain